MPENPEQPPRVKKGLITEPHVLQSDGAGLPHEQGNHGVVRLHHVKGHELLQRGLLRPR